MHAQAEYIGTKRGHYKVLTSLALDGGMYATYYAGAGGPNNLYPKGGIPSFHRAEQLADSEHDFVSPCVFRKWKEGVPLSTYECSSPGYTFSNTNDHEESGTAQDGGSTTTIKLKSGSSTTDDFYNGMHIALIGGIGQGAVREITDYDGGTLIATVATLPEAPGATTHYKIVGSKPNRNSGWIKGGFATGGEIRA